eukprot:PhM_4_TR14360/c0_g3_i1/m.41721
MLFRRTTLCRVAAAAAAASSSPSANGSSCSSSSSSGCSGSSPPTPASDNDVRSRYCILCCEEVHDWSHHFASTKHMALRTVGNYYHGFFANKTTNNKSGNNNKSYVSPFVKGGNDNTSASASASSSSFASELEHYCGIKTTALEPELHATKRFRQKQLGELVTFLLSDAVYPHRGTERDREVCRLIGEGVLYKDALSLLCRIHPAWTPHQLGSLAHMITTRDNILSVERRIFHDDEMEEDGCDENEKKSALDLLAAIGHFQRAETFCRHRLPLTTLTRHAVDATCYELYSAFVDERLSHIEQSWSFYQDQKKHVLKASKEITDISTEMPITSSSSSSSSGTAADAAVDSGVVLSPPSTKISPCTAHAINASVSTTTGAAPWSTNKRVKFSRALATIPPTITASTTTVSPTSSTSSSSSSVVMMMLPRVTTSRRVIKATSPERKAQEAPKDWRAMDLARRIPMN